MKNPFKKNKPIIKSMEKVLVNRDLSAELNFYNDRHSIAIGAANKWIIPLMLKFEIPVSVEAINEIMTVNVRDAFIDAIIRKKDKDILWPSDWNRHKSEAEHVLDAAVTELIEQGKRLKAFETEYEGYLANYQNQINAAKRELERVYNGDRVIELNQKIDSIHSSIANTESSKNRRRREIIEDEKRDFNDMVEAKLTLGMARNFVKIENNRLDYDKEEVEKRFAIYADTEQEIALLDKVKHLAELINEVYGSQFAEPKTAFYHFFSVSSDNGRVIINPEIKKETLIKYAKEIK